ncbi:hypothetical protein CG740_23390 [Streptomyces sp. CB01201]|uniref:hypothetical protein n=1 Tax=Streptomyces sp. CB01201 TaxID=2020324 RepID=UPI000C26DE2B|nr:hypothetical protein [Streptomyces sp. CB01201]PJN00850.1 hypothetical protein CG740_23390 [Streptomyces sp. CB01201]
MKQTRVIHTTIFLDGLPEDLRLDGAIESDLVLRLSGAATLHLTETRPDTLRRAAELLAVAADMQECQSLKAVA